MSFIFNISKSLTFLQEFQLSLYFLNKLVFLSLFVFEEYLRPERKGHIVLPEPLQEVHIPLPLASTALFLMCRFASVFEILKAWLKTFTREYVFISPLSILEAMNSNIVIYLFSFSFSHKFATASSGVDAPT